MAAAMNCLLDTCTLLWLANDPTILPADVRDLLRRGEMLVRCSAISALELGIKIAGKKLRLPLPVSRWFPAFCRRNNLHILPVDHRVAAASIELPDIHRDPFDRILIATAIEHRLTLLTPDETIRSYPNLKTLW